MDIKSNLSYLYGLNRLGIKTSLDNIKALGRELGNPQNSYPIVHIAGTNGKGMTAAMLHNILHQAGYRSGLYTSPHLQRFGERIRVGQNILTDLQAGEYIEELRPLFERVQSTFFESTTVIAFWHFKRARADIAIIEVGLGGSWDATNIVNPIISIFTPISLDHIDRLGNEVGQIAADKAGIIKPGADVVSALQEKAALTEIRKKSDETNCPFHYAPQEFPILAGKVNPFDSNVTVLSGRNYEFKGNWRIPAAGKHQWINLQTVLSAVTALQNRGFNLPLNLVKKGVETVQWAGRLQVLQKAPLVYFDVAHNPAAAKVIREFFLEVFPACKPRILMGIVNDKDIAGVIAELSLIAADFTFVELPTHRSAEGELLALDARLKGSAARVIKNPSEALRIVMQETPSDKIILIIGSHYWGEAVFDFFK